MTRALETRLRRLEAKHRPEGRTVFLAWGRTDEEASHRVSLARAAGEIGPGDLHRRVGDYPGTNHRMPTCCNVMREAMQPGDRIVAAPPKGNGASLTVRYQLPRELGALAT